MIKLEHIEETAEEILRDLKIRTVPVPVEEIASRYKVKISRAPSADFSGLLIRKDGHALIGINSKEAPVRQRFTIAHELGHFFLHPNKDAFVDYRGNDSEAPRIPKEREANMFAAALLMPRGLLEKDFRALAKNGFTEIELRLLAHKYHVSEDAMRYRLLNLNLNT